MRKKERFLSVPPGYKYDVEMKMCVPKTNKDSIGKRSEAWQQGPEAR